MELKCCTYSTANISLNFIYHFNFSFSAIGYMERKLALFRSPEEGLYLTVGTLFYPLREKDFFLFDFAFYLSPKLRKGEDFIEF